MVKEAAVIGLTVFQIVAIRYAVISDRPATIQEIKKLGDIQTCAWPRCSMN